EKILVIFDFERAKSESVRSKAADLERWLTNEIAKLEEKLTKLQKEIHAAEKLDMYQLYGELLTANSYAIEKGATEATVENYYEQGTFDIGRASRRDRTYIKHQNIKTNKRITTSVPYLRRRG